MFNPAVIRFKLRLALTGVGWLETWFRRAQRSTRLVRQAIENPSRAALAAWRRAQSAGRAETPNVSRGKRRVSAASRRALGLPIIFIHRSNSDYLKYTFAQARASNPESPLYLLGDRSNDLYDEVEHHSMFDYFRQAEEFQTLYRHFSTNGFDYELINFQRWFVLREFLLAHRIARCLYLDSDTLLYTDVTEDSKKFAGFDFTLSQMTSGCTFFLNRREALGEFCRFLFDVYSRKDKYHYDKMAAHYMTRKINRLPGGVCDMTAFGLYHELHFGEIGEAAQIIDGSVYDPAITSPAPGFEMADGVKKLSWRDGAPYGTQIRTGHEVKFNSLQFQGDSKHLMREYCTAEFQKGSSASKHPAMNLHG